MRQVTRKGLITVAAAGGVLALSGGSAFADATAAGGAENSPGVLSGNQVQVPVHVPVNLCGNSVNVVGLLNPTFGNNCVNDGGQDHGPGKPGGGHHEDGGHQGGGHEGGQPDGAHQGGGHHGGGSTAEGGATNSPGVGSGNQVQVPIEVPLNVCGNTVDVIAALNPTFGNECVNASGHTEWEPPAVDHPDKPEEETPDKPDSPKDQPPGAPETQIVAQPELAQTGADYELETALGMGAALLLGGTILYRRARVAQR